MIINEIIIKSILQTFMKSKECEKINIVIKKIDDNQNIIYIYHNKTPVFSYIFNYTENKFTINLKKLLENLNIK